MQRPSVRFEEEPVHAGVLTMGPVPMGSTQCPRPRPKGSCVLGGASLGGPQWSEASRVVALPCPPRAEPSGGSLGTSHCRCPHSSVPSRPAQPGGAMRPASDGLFSTRQGSASWLPNPRLPERRRVATCLGALRTGALTALCSAEAPVRGPDPPDSPSVLLGQLCQGQVCELLVSIR